MTTTGATHSPTRGPTFSPTADKWGAAVAASYTANAVEFTGAADLMGNNSLVSTTGNTKKFILSFWIYPVSSVSGSIIRLSNAGGTPRLTASFVSSNRISLTATNSAGTDIATWVSQTSAFTADAWQHVVWAVDTDSAGTPQQQVYRNGSALTAGASSLTSDGIVDTIGRFHVPDVSASATTLYFAEIYFASGSFLDMSTNITKFRSLAGKPVDLGSNGSTPTGSQPYAYFANAFGSFQTNKGSGDSLTVTGTLSAAPSSPSD